MKKRSVSKLLTAVVVFILSVKHTSAQEVHTLSAGQATEMAFNRLLSLENLRLDKKIQEATNKEITGQALPQIKGTASLMHYFNIPVTFIPDFISPAVYDVLVNEGVKDQNGNPIVKPGGEPQLFPAAFGVPWQASVGFSIEQLIFQPDVFVGLKARDASIQLTEYNIKVMEDSVKANVLRSYYSVVIAEKQKKILEQSVSRLEKLLSDQTEMFKNGFAEKLDIERTQVTLNNLKTSFSQITNLVQLGYAALKFATGLHQTDSIVLTDDLNSEMLKEGILEMAENFRYEDRNEIGLLNTMEELNSLDLQRYKLGKIPTIAAFWNFSENAQRQKFNFFSSKEDWYKTSVVGLNISVPLFSGFSQNRRIEKARLNLEKTRNNITDLKRAIDFQQVSAINSLKNALSAVEAQERNMELAEKVYNTTKLKFEQGLGSSFEILQAQTEYETAQSNYFQALYDAMIARVNYIRALGKL